MLVSDLEGRPSLGHSQGLLDPCDCGDGGYDGESLRLQNEDKVVESRRQLVVPTCNVEFLLDDEPWLVADRLFAHPK